MMNDEALRELVNLWDNTSPSKCGSDLEKLIATTNKYGAETGALVKVISSTVVVYSTGSDSASTSISSQIGSSIGAQISSSISSSISSLPVSPPASPTVPRLGKALKYSNLRKTMATPRDKNDYLTPMRSSIQKDPLNVHIVIAFPHCEILNICSNGTDAAKSITHSSVNNKFLSVQEFIIPLSCIDHIYDIKTAISKK